MTRIFPLLAMMLLSIIHVVILALLIRRGKTFFLDELKASYTQFETNMELFLQYQIVFKIRMISYHCRCIGYILAIVYLCFETPIIQGIFFLLALAALPI